MTTYTRFNLEGKKSVIKLEKQLKIGKQFFFLFQDMVSLSTPSCLGTCSVDQAVDQTQKSVFFASLVMGSNV